MSCISAIKFPKHVVFSHQCSACTKIKVENSNIASAKKANYYETTTNKEISGSTSSKSLGCTSSANRLVKRSSTIFKVFPFCSKYLFTAFVWTFLLHVNNKYIEERYPVLALRPDRQIELKRNWVSTSSISDAFLINRWDQYTAIIIGGIHVFPQNDMLTSIMQSLQTLIFVLVTNLASLLVCKATRT